MAEAAVPYKQKRKEKKFMKPPDLAQRRVYGPEEFRLPWSYKRTNPYRYAKALWDYYQDFIDNLRGLGD